MANLLQLSTHLKASDNEIRSPLTSFFFAQMVFIASSNTLWIMDKSEGFPYARMVLS